GGVHAMRRLTILLLVSCLPATAAWDGFSLIQTVPAKAGGSATSPYSLLISGTYPQFAAVASGGHVKNTVPCGVNSITCPADLIFTRDSQCTTPYSGWDILSWSPSTGQLSVVLEIPILSNLRPAKIYACAGSPAVNTYQGGGRGSAYDSNYLLALHLDETSGTILHDSTANANDAVKKSAAAPAPVTAGKLGGGQQFTGTASSTNNDYALFESVTEATNTYTMEYWTKATSYVDLDSVFLGSDGLAGGPVIHTGFYFYPAGSVLYRNSWCCSSPHAPATASAGTFHNIVFVRSGDTMNVYVDGVPGTAATGFGDGAQTWMGLGWDGGVSSVFNSFNGILDEAFLSKVARSADYITARFNNVNSPSTFCTVGPFGPITPIPQSTTQANSQVNIF
ncbi:MAG TPA: LamG-like jellyroll fold domain-containing protein, partial [Bryobacteraceae bacterium]|nr:LamG-like jellyroll fold domain-containing protein [Bryobacteraceae bacterium]